MAGHHDSFIVDYHHVRLLKAAMRRASKGVSGFELAVESDGLGLDEIEHDKQPRDAVLDFINWRQPPRSPAYLDRLAVHEARVAGEGQPVLPLTGDSGVDA